VTDEERKEFDGSDINGYAYLYEPENCEWNTNLGSPLLWERDKMHYAVPIGTTFAKPEPEPEATIMVDGKPYSESTIKNALQAYVA
jgi:hypothetical protein